MNTGSSNELNATVSLSSQQGRDWAIYVFVCGVGIDYIATACNCTREEFLALLDDVLAWRQKVTIVRPCLDRFPWTERTRKMLRRMHANGVNLDIAAGILCRSEFLVRAEWKEMNRG